jgi:aminomethyltransferase
MVDTPLKTTPLYELHQELGGKLVPFAGYAMPVQYPAGILAEHLHCRAAASLFDVSHMGQVRLDGADAAALLETLVPGDILGLKPGRIRYTVFTNASGGILDDLMVTNAGDHLFLVVNAARKDHDIAHLRSVLGDRVTVLEDRALLALQGPGAARAMENLAPGAAAMGFMTAQPLTVAGIPCVVSRSGYTGEDGYEISVPAAQAPLLAADLLAEEGVMPAGLGARDSLRLEAGLSLYGSDIDETTTPIEADLAWTIGKRRREQGGFPGAEVILRQLADGPARLRVGIKPLGRAPARAHTEIQDFAGNRIGEITSGGFGPSVNGPVAMGYVEAAAAKLASPLRLIIRGAAHDAVVAALPFVPHRYAKGK